MSLIINTDRLPSFSQLSVRPKKKQNSFYPAEFSKSSIIQKEKIITYSNQLAKALWEAKQRYKTII